MRKILTKTITSILICLSLAFSSIGFLPMSAFAGTDDAGMENSPVNLEFKEEFPPPTYLKLEEGKESYDFKNAVNFEVDESLSVSSYNEKIVSVNSTTIKAVAPGMATITVQKRKNRTVLAVAEVEIMVPRFVGSIKVEDDSVMLSGDFYDDEGSLHEINNQAVTFGENAKIGDVDVSALVEKDSSIGGFNIKDTVLIEEYGYSPILSGTLNVSGILAVHSNATLDVSRNATLDVSGTLNVLSNGTLEVQPSGSLVVQDSGKLKVYKNAKINQHTFNEYTEIKETNITANDYQN